MVSGPIICQNDIEPVFSETKKGEENKLSCALEKSFSFNEGESQGRGIAFEWRKFYRFKSECQIAIKKCLTIR